MQQYPNTKGFWTTLLPGRILFLDCGHTTGPGRSMVSSMTFSYGLLAKTLLDRTAQIKTDESPLPVRYLFAARSDNALTGERDHDFPPAPTEVFGAGFWVMAPDHKMFAYFLSVMDHYRRFDPHTMEQGLLNYAYRRAGPMPWAEPHYRWSATWPNSKDLEGKVVALHEKLWSTGPEDLRNLWWSYESRMDMYHSEHTPMQ